MPDGEAMHLRGGDTGGLGAVHERQRRHADRLLAIACTTASNVIRPVACCACLLYVQRPRKHSVELYGCISAMCTMAMQRAQHPDNYTQHSEQERACW